jgi:type IV fimbrial biogenesis protein FimT
MRKTQHGFTLIELVVTTTIIAILMSIGVPSFRYVTTNNRVSSEINGLLGDLQFARAEAIKRGLLVSVCASNDGKTCLGTATWSGGWVVFSDAGAVGSVDGTDQLLRVQKALSGGDTMVADTAGFSAITFNREGFARGLAGPVLLKLHDSKSLAQYTRCMSITVVGALSTQKYGGGCT